MSEVQRSIPGPVLDRFRRAVDVVIDPFVLGLYRICLGAYLALSYVMLGRDWLEFYGPNGWAPDASSRHVLDSLLIHVPSDAAMWAVYGVCLAAGAALILGRLGRAPVLWLWAANYSMMYRNLGTANAEEQILAVLLLFSLFLPLDAALVPGKTGPERVRLWALLPLQVYVALIYAFSLPWKIRIEPAWYDGTLVYYAASELLYSRWPDLGRWIGAAGAAPSFVASYYTLVVEALFPVLVWLRSARPYVVAAMMVLHASIGLLLEGVTLFNAGMCVALVLFLPSRRTREVCRRLGDALAGRGPLRRPEAPEGTP